MKQHVSGQMKLKQEIYSQAVDYFRTRPDEFCEDVIGIKLNVYQKVMLRAIFKYDYVMFIMCRTWFGQNVPCHACIGGLCSTLSKF